MTTERRGMTNLWLIVIIPSVLVLKTDASLCEDAIGPNPSIEEETVTLTFGCSYDALTVEWEGIYDYEYGGIYLESVNHLQYTCYDINGTEVMADGLYDDIPEVDSIDNSAEASITVNLPQTAVKCNLTGCYTRSDSRHPYLFTPKSCDVTGARPVILPLPNKTEVWAGSNINLTCHVTGSPQPDVTWEKDGEPFDPGLYPNVTYLNGELVFHEANEEVSGNYSCVATNFIGNETSEPTNVIVIFEHPNITTTPPIPTSTPTTPPIPTSTPVSPPSAVMPTSTSLSTQSDVIVIIGVEAAIVLVVGIALVVLLAAVFTVLAVGVNKYVNSKRSQGIQMKSEKESADI